MDSQLIECEFHLSAWYTKRNLYTCVVRNKLICDKKEIKFIGEHKDGMKNADVRGIAITNCRVSKVPQGLMKIFPNLQVFQVSNSKLKFIEQDDLKEYTNLSYISFPCNEIEYLPGDLFAHMRNLEMISFQGNQIQVIEPNLLDGLSKLKILYFYGNQCIDKWHNDDNNMGNATIQEIRDEIREKFSTSLWRRIFGIKNTLKNENQLLKKTVDEHKGGLCDDLKEIVKNENFKDFVITIGDEEFKVHKFLLAARIPVLKEIIENNIDAECLNLVDISTDIFREILNFIYTDQLPNTTNIDLINLFAAAGRLKIEKLKNFAADKLLDTINIENSVEILTLAKKYESENLKQKSYEKIKEFLDESIDDDLITQPEKLIKLIELKKMKETMMKQLDLQFKKLLNE